MSGAVPPPAGRPPGRAAGVPRPVYPGCGWCGPGDPAPAPQRVPSQAIVARCGGDRAASWGGCLSPLWGASEFRRSPSPGCPPSRQAVGPTTHVLLARVCRCEGPALSPWLACPVGGCVPRGRWGPSPGGGGCQRCEGRLVSGAVPPPAARPPGRAAGVPRPVCPGCGWCGRGDPAPAPKRAPLRAVIARCGGDRRASPGGLPCAVVRVVWGQALLLSRLPALWAGCRGPLPTCCGRGCAGVGAQHCPLGLHALWGLLAAGLVGGCPRGGWPSTIVRGLWCWALSLPRPSVPCGGQPGFRDQSVFGAVGPGVGVQHQLHSVCPCDRPCAPWGWRKGAPWGGAFRHCPGRLGSGAPPPPAARPLGGLLGSAAHVLWVRVCGCGGPALSPWLACPVGAACHVGGGGPSPGEEAFHCCDGRLVSGAVPPPATSPLEQVAGVPRSVCPRCR